MADAMDTSEALKNGHHNDEDMEEFRNSIHEIQCEKEVFGTCLRNQFLKLYDNSLFSDVRLQLKNGQMFNGHKTILAATSIKFKDLLAKQDSAYLGCKE
jgi:hypothetical protein